MWSSAIAWGRLPLRTSRGAEPRRRGTDRGHSRSGHAPGGRTGQDDRGRHFPRRGPGASRGSAQSVPRAVNGPKSVTISGRPETIDAFSTLLQESGCRVRALDVSIAFHSPDMEAAKEQLIEGLNGLEPAALTIALRFHGERQAGERSRPGWRYWAKCSRAGPVRTGHGRAEERGDRRGRRDWPSSGAHSVDGRVPRFGTTNAIDPPHPRRGREGMETLLRSAAMLETRGFDVDWASVTPPGRFTSFPAYPWQRERYWFDDGPLMDPGQGHAGGDNGRAGSPDHGIARARAIGASERHLPGRERPSLADALGEAGIRSAKRGRRSRTLADPGRPGLQGVGPGNPDPVEGRHLHGRGAHRNRKREREPGRGSLARADECSRGRDPRNAGCNARSWGHLAQCSTSRGGQPAASPRSSKAIAISWEARCGSSRRRRPARTSQGLASGSSPGGPNRSGRTSSLRACFNRPSGGWAARSPARLPNSGEA